MKTTQTTAPLTASEIMQTRKIAYVPALSALYTMPLSYDPSLVTREDAVHDSQIELATQTAAFWRGTSLQAQEMARDTSRIGYEGEAADAREERAQEALDALEAAWDRVVAALEGAEDLRDALEDAQRIERAWGDDQPSRTMLAMLDAATEETA